MDGAVIELRTREMTQYGIRIHVIWWTVKREETGPPETRVLLRSLLSETFYGQVAQESIKDAYRTFIRRVLTCVNPQAHEIITASRAEVWELLASELQDALLGYNTEPEEGNA